MATSFYFLSGAVCAGGFAGEILNVNPMHENQSEKIGLTFSDLIATVYAACGKPTTGRSHAGGADPSVASSGATPRAVQELVPSKLPLSSASLFGRWNRRSAGAAGETLYREMTESRN